MSSDAADDQSLGLIHIIGLNVVPLPEADADVGASAGASAGASGAVDSIDSQRTSNDQAELDTQAQQILLTASVLIGSPRQLATVAHIVEHRARDITCIELPKLDQLKALLDSHASLTVALLASGDPLLYGIGRWLGKQFSQSRLRFYPAISSVQLACSRTGLSWQDIRVVSLHGRPVETLRRHLRNHAKLMVLTDAHSHPARLAEECVAAGFISTRITVFEYLGYSAERVRKFPVADLLSSGPSAKYEHADLNIVLLELAGATDTPLRQLPVFPGMPDHLFVTGTAPGKGMITKREVRLSILSFLSPGNNDVIWDIGAGCGSVAIELAYWNERATVYAIEHHADRLIHLQTNQSNFGVVKNLTIVPGRAPDALKGLPQPDKVFIGGSDGKLDVLLALSWAQLPTGGLLVASAVTENTRHVLVSFARTLHTTQVQSAEILVKRGELQDDGMEYTEKLPVEIFRFQKS